MKMKQFRQFNVLIAIVLLICSIVLMINILFTPQPIQIILETGQAINTQSSSYFTLNIVILLIICASIIGAAITYLFYNSESNNFFKKSEKSADSENHIIKEASKNTNYDMIMPLLKDDERKIVHIIKDNNGEILQNTLVLKSGYSKVHTTRIIASLERKQIVQKHRHGLTNNIKLIHR